MDHYQQAFAREWLSLFALQSTEHRSPPPHPLQQLGWLYVLAGSRLGHCFIAKKIAQNNPAIAPLFFQQSSLTANHDFVRAMEQIQTVVHDEADFERVTKGAQDCFQRFIIKSGLPKEGRPPVFKGGKSLQL